MNVRSCFFVLSEACCVTATTELPASFTCSGSITGCTVGEGRSPVDYGDGAQVAYFEPRHGWRRQDDAHRCRYGLSACCLRNYVQ